MLALSLLSAPPTFAQGREDPPYSNEDLAAALEVHGKEVMACGKRAKPAASGSVDVNFTIAGDGSVKDLTVSVPSSSPAADACVVKAMTKWKFPKKFGFDFATSVTFRYDSNAVK